MGILDTMRIVRNLAISYICDHLNGVVDGNRYQYVNWSINTGVDKSSEAYKKAVELINNGTIILPASENGRTIIASITVSDVSHVFKHSCCYVCFFYKKFCKDYNGGILF